MLNATGTVAGHWSSDYAAPGAEKEDRITTATSPLALQAKGEPKLEEKAGNWFAENWVNTNPVEVKNATAKNAVYIANSENSVFKIDNKVQG